MTPQAAAQRIDDLEYQLDAALSELRRRDTRDLAEILREGLGGSLGERRGSMWSQAFLGLYGRDWRLAEIELGWRAAQLLRDAAGVTDPRMDPRRA